MHKMFRSDEEFEKIIDKLNIDVEPNPTHRQRLRRQMLSAFTDLRKPSFAERIKTMKNIIKIAAVLIVAFGIFGISTMFVQSTGSIAFADVVIGLT